MDLLSPAWIWMYFGAFLMLAELASPGFVVFFFGLGAATVAPKGGGSAGVVVPWRWKWHPTPVFLPGESQGRGSLVGCRLWRSERAHV